MKLFDRHLTQTLTQKVSPNVLLAVMGPRQSGKTTLIRTLLPRLTGKQADYVTFDDPDERVRFGRSTIPALRALSGPLILLDEVQKAPDVLDGVKYLFDSGQAKNSTIILTGSAQLLMLQRVQETLAGRISLFELLPLSMAEVNRTPVGTTLLDSIWQVGRFNREMAETLAFAPMEGVRAKEAVRNNLLTYGGYPPVVTAADAGDKQEWLRNYRRTYIERDVPDAGGVGDMDMFLRIQQLLALRTANLLSYAEVARDAGCSPHTVRRYLQTLETTFAAFRLQPYHSNRGKRLIKSPKVFYADTGVASSIVRGGISPGALYETFIFSELIKWKGHLSAEVELSFYRTSAGLEIDFLIETEQQMLPIEAKSVEQVRKADARSLSRFIEEFGDRAPFGLVVYRGREVVELAEKVYAVPDWLLLG